MPLSPPARRTHRWTSVLFTAIVAALVAAPAVRAVADWLCLIPLAPRAVMVITGLSLFALPSLPRRS